MAGNRRAWLWCAALSGALSGHAADTVGMPTTMATPPTAKAEPLAARVAPFAPKILVINLFGFEAAPWVDALKPSTEIRVAGLTPEFPAVKCNADGVCQMTTGMGHANAAASLMAVLFSGQFDLRRTYFLVAGIAGIDPLRGTIGSVAWARYVVDSGIAHEIDARELPKGWRDGYFGVMTDSPDQVPKMEYHSEVYRLDEALLQKALVLSRGVTLDDSAAVRDYRAHYPHAPANRPPAVAQCDTLSADTWWGGRWLGERARRWASLLTGGKAVYCTTQQEDNALLTALTRGSEAGLLDLQRVAVLRAGSDFDRPYPGQDAYSSMRAQRDLSGSGRIAADNLVHAGMPLVEDVVRHWDDWAAGVPR